MRFFNTVLFRSLAGSSVIIIVFVWIAYLIGQQQIDTFDHRIIDVIRGLNSDNMTLIMKGFTTIGSGILVSSLTVIILLVLVFLGYRRELFFFLAVIVGSGLLNIGIKLLFHRARPDINRIIQASGYSFPSGHSMSALVFYGIAVYFLWKHLRYRWIRISVLVLSSIMILMIGISRIYLGVHYPSDVIGGYLMSAAWLTASIGLYERFLKKRWTSRKLQAI